MKTYITKSSIWALVLVLAGFLFAFPGAREMWRYSHVKNISELTSKDIKNGAYIEGEVTEYIGYVRGHRFMGVAGTWIELDGDYDSYTIPLKDGKYVQIRIVDSDLKAKLEDYEMGKGEGVVLTGKIKPCDNYSDRSFYEKIEDFNPDDVITGLAATEVKSVEQKPKNFFGGLALMAVGVILFLKSLIHM